MALDDYLRIQRAIEFIESHIHENITLEDVSRNITLSPFYFHRIFHSVLGETVTEYVKKRRLSFAAEDLLTTKSRILDIALNYGYESQEAFTRAFKHMFGVTPGAFRKNHRQYQFLYEQTKRKPFDHQKIAHLGGIHKMKPKKMKKDAFHIVGLQLHSSRASEIPALWEKLDKVHHRIRHKVSETVFLGVMEPTGVNVEFYYIAGMEVTKISDVPEGMVGKSFPASEYVVFTHKGSTETLQDTYQYIYGTWFPKQKCRRGKGPEFERYDDERFFGPMDPNSEIDIYIPINSTDQLEDVVDK